VAKVKTPAPKVGGPSQDLPPRGNLPDVSVIKPGAGFGDDIKTKKPGGRAGGGYIQKMAKGGMPDLTGDGKVTRADVLKGRGVFKKGGAVKSSASKRADGIAQRGKTRGKMV